jgi:hypothetical protein
MKVKSRVATLLASVLFAWFAGAAVLLAALRVVDLGIGQPTFRNVLGDFRWTVFFTEFPALFGGLIAGAFLWWRAPRVSRFTHLLLESTGLAIVLAVPLVQFLLPRAWDLPRARWALVSALGAGAVSALGTLLLKPFYWPRDAAGSEPHF